MGAIIVKQGFTHGFDAGTPHFVALLQRKTLFFTQIGGQGARLLVQ